MTTSSRALLAAALLATVPSAADAKSVLVISAHPDDEVFIAAGRARAALGAGDDIKLVIMTNGDTAGVADGYFREQQSVASALAIGLTANDVIFMGYGDGAMHDLWHDESHPDLVYPSPAGVSTTYAGPYGFAGTDYHRHWTGGSAGAPYTRTSIVADLRALFREFLPDEIYTHGTWDQHLDHTAVASFIHLALLEEKRVGTNLRTKVYEAFVWMPHSDGGWAVPWPQMTTAPDGFTPLNPFVFWSSPCVPGSCLDLTNREESRASRFMQPAEMRTTSASTNLKALAVPGGLTVQQGWFGSWVRKDEVFWLTQDLSRNIAASATLTFSSQHGWWLPTTGEWVGTVEQAVDGLWGGITGCIWQREWLANTYAMGSWIQLTWPAAQRISQVNLYDRLDPSNNVTGSHLTFADGTTYDVGPLEYDGKPSIVHFDPPIVTSSLRFTIDGWLGNPENHMTVPALPGLQEIQVFGVPASATANTDPYFVWGPYAAATTIPASQSVDIAALARDLDGDTVAYTWSADAGFIAPYLTGYATFTPPPVTENTFVSINVVASDGRGGTASNWWHVLVTPAPTDALTLAPATVFGSQPSVGTVVLSAAAGGGGVTVPLSSGNSAVASVPASVTVPAGQTTATFPIATTAVGSNTTVTITAGFSAGGRSANLVVAPRAVSSLSVSPSNTLGGNTVQGTVTLPVAAAGSGVAVALSSDDAHAVVPTSVTVPAGQASATFSITTSAVTTAVNATLTATYGSTTSAVLTVSPLAISSITFEPAVVLGGTGTTGTVTLNGTAPGDVVVNLTSADPALVMVPASATVLAGTSSRTFTVTTSTVTGPVSVSVSATSGGATATAPLTLTNHLSNANLLQNGEPLTGAGWDNWGGVTVTANHATAPNGSTTATRFVSTSGAHAYRQAVNVASTQQYTFSFWARNNGGTAASYSIVDVTHSYPITIPDSPAYITSITSGWTRFSTTFTTPVDCTSIAVYPLRDSGTGVDVVLWGAKLEAGATATGYDTFDTVSVSVSPTSVRSGDVASGLVEIGWAAPAGGVTIPLTSSDPAVAVPPSVTVPAGATSATFSLSAGTVSTATTATITAAFPIVSRTATLTVNPLPRVASVSLSPTSLIGGASSTGTVTLTEAALAGGLEVQLSSGNAAAAVPASVTVAQGATTATFTVTTSAVAQETSAVITATGGATATATLTITTNPLAGLSLSPAIVLGGVPSTGTVTLAAAAPAGGAVVSLSTDGPAAAAPATVTVAAGNTSGSFTVTTSVVAANTPVVVTASYLGSSATATLSVRAPVLTGLTLSPSTATGGSAATGTVTLNGPAPTGGVVVTLSSADAATAAVPAQVTVAAGSTSAGFSITTVPVASDTPVTITASAGSAAPTATLTVARPRVASLSVSPTVVLGGISATATVRLNGPAPAGGISVSLGDNSASASEPATVLVPGTATSATFTVTTVPLATRTAVTLTAAIAADTAVTTTLTIARPVVTGFTITPATVVGGSGTTGTVTLNGPAPAGGVSVSITTRSGASMTFPASVTVAEGATSAPVAIGTSPVAVNTSRTLTASSGGGSRSASFTITPPAVTGVSLSPTSVTGGGTVTGTVTLNGPAPAGTTVALSSGNTSIATVPASVAVTTGATTATFTVTTLAIPLTTSVSIGASGGGGSASATLSVGGFTVTGLSFSPATVVGGYPSTGTVTISGTAPTGGFAVTLSDRSSAVSVPGSVAIPEGSSTATFTVTTVAVAASTSPPITASANAVNFSAPLTVIPLAVTTVSVAPTSVVGGTPALGTVTLNAVALADTAVALGSDSTSAAVPASVVVPTGSASGSFPITTSGVAQNADVTISATLAGTATTTLTVQAP